MNIKLILNFLAFVLIISSCKKKPEACFEIDKSTANVNENINFNAICSSEASDYNWNFGDGSNSIGASVSHSYSTPGSFTVTLTATNKSGDSQTSKQIQINGANPNDPLCVQNNFGFVVIQNNYDSDYSISINGEDKGIVYGYGTSAAFQYPTGTTLNVTITQINGYILYPSVYYGSGVISQCTTLTIQPN